MNEQERHDLFCELISRHHCQLYAYIFAIVRNHEDANDLFQSVCLVLWRKFESFRPGSSFFSWARQTAKFVTRSFLRHEKRVSSVAIEDFLDTLAETVARVSEDDPELYLDVLRRCKAKLNLADAELLDLRYAENLGSREIADRLQRPQPSVCHSLTRIRKWLLNCIQMELARRDHSTY